MTPQRKKEISEALIEALNREDLHLRQAAGKLNINPIYISMAKKPESWHAMGAASWARLEEWHNTRLKISEFKIPEGEEIWKPKEKPAVQDKEQKEKDEKEKNLLELQKAEELAIVEERKINVAKLTGQYRKNSSNYYPEEGNTKAKEQGVAAMEVIDQEEHSPENITKEPEKEKNGRSVKIMLQTAEIKKLNKEVTELKVQIDIAHNKLFVIEDETITVMRQEIKDLQEGMAHLVTIPKRENRPGIVIFQRNIYKA